MKYIKFFKTKRESCFKEVKLAFEEISDDSLKDNVYSKEDVEKIIDQLSKEVQKTVTQEVEAFNSMAGLFTQMLLHDAEKQNVSLIADLPYLDNYKAIEDFKAFEKSTFGMEKTLNLKSKAVAQRLPTLNSAYNNDPSIVNLLSEKELQVSNLEEKIVDLQKRLTKVLSEKSQLSEVSESQKCKAEKLEEELKESNSEISSKNSEESKRKIDSLSEENKKLREEASKKVSELTQVTSMKKMIQEKNATINKLRSKLEKHEPGTSNDDI